MTTPSEQEARRFVMRHRPALDKVSGRLLIALSGGADSTALLRLCIALRRDVVAVHCNFHLRGPESMRDEQFVRTLCEAQGIKLIVENFDARAEAESRSVSIETACRDLRYAKFRSLAEELNCSRIVAAHNADDNAETLLMHLFRGAGIQGLKSMVTDDGELLRPLLGASRSEIISYLGALGQAHVEDSTNASSDYRRNFIRNEVIPLVQTRWPGVKQAIGKTIANLQSEAAIIGQLEPLCEGDRLLWCDLERSADSQALIQRFAMKHGANRSMVLEMKKVADEKASGRVWKTDAGRIHSERFGFQFIGEADEKEEKFEDIFTSREIIFDDKERQTMMADRSNRVLYLPADGTELQWRHPLTGDRMWPLGMKGSRLLSDIMSDAGLSRAERESLWVAADPDSGEIIWAEGLKRSRRRLLGKNDTKAVKISRKTPEIEDTCK